MNPVSVDIKDMLLDEEDLGLVFGGNLHIGREPARPDNCLTIYDAPGGGVDLTSRGDRERYYRHEIQVRVRNASYMGAWTLVNAVVDRLHARAGETWNSVFYSLIRASSAPFVLEWDENNRVIFVANFNVQRR